MKLRWLLPACAAFLALVDALAASSPPVAEPQWEDSFYRVQWVRVDDLPRTLAAGETVRVLVTIRNTGSSIWPDAQMANPVELTPGRAVRLTYRWWDGERDVLVSDYTDRSDLPWPLRPGEAITLPLLVQAPRHPGRFRLQLELVHELVEWFEKRGATRWVASVEVRPGS